jgi:predicted peptidase
MRSLLPLAVGLSAVVAVAGGWLAEDPPAAPPAAPAPSIVVSSGTTTLKWQDGSVEATYQYRLVEPPAATIADGKRVPLIIFLHGAGERGDDNKAQLTHFVRSTAEASFQEKHPCFILAMQCPKSETWSELNIQALREANATPTFSTEPLRAMRAVMAAMDDVLATRQVDRSRVYLTGLSMGGFGSFDLAARRPELFAAVVPICGGGDPATASKVASIPFFIVHGDDDPIVPVRLSRTMRDAIAAAQPKAPDAAGAAPKNPSYREYSKVGHDSWTSAYRFGPDGVLDWMFAQRRSVQ